MQPDFQYFYLANGLILMFVGLIFGFPFARAIKKDNGAERAWRVAHSATTSGAILFMALAPNIRSIKMSGQENWLVLACLMIGVYTFVAGMAIAAFCGERGIGHWQASPNNIWRTVFVLYLLGSLFTLVSIGHLLVRCIFI